MSKSPGRCFATTVILYRGFRDSNKAQVSPETPALPALMLDSVKLAEDNAYSPEDDNGDLRHGEA